MGCCSLFLIPACVRLFRLHNSGPKMRGVNNRKLFSQSLEPRSPRSRFWTIWFLVRGLLLAWRWPPPGCGLTCPFLGKCTQRTPGQPCLSLLLRTRILSDQSPGQIPGHKRPHLALISSFFLGPISKYGYIRG